MKRLRFYKSMHLLSILLVAITLSPGCKQKGPQKPQIALIMKSLANEFFKTMEDGAVTHYNENSDKYDLIPVGIKDELDVAGQFIRINYRHKIVLNKTTGISGPVACLPQSVLKRCQGAYPAEKFKAHTPDHGGNMEKHNVS